MATSRGADGKAPDTVLVWTAGELRQAVNQAKPGVRILLAAGEYAGTLARNFWYCLDNPRKSRPTLPTPELDGVYGKSPQFRDTTGGDLRLQPRSPARHFGAEGLPHQT